MKKLSPATVPSSLRHQPKYSVQREYGVTGAELDALSQRLDAEIQRERKGRRIRRFTGNLHATLRD